VRIIQYFSLVFTPSVCCIFFIPSSFVKQSKLLPHKSPETESSCDQKRGKECNAVCGDGESEGEEYCGIQKKDTRKGKATPQSITPKKVQLKLAVYKHEVVKFLVI
jgi:hypothetical protein